MTLLLIIGIVIGLVLGLTGAGGSVFAVPLLIIFLKMPAEDAMGVALAAVSLSAAYGIGIRWRKRQFFVIPALLLGVTGVVTAPLGKWAAVYTPDHVLQGLFSLLAVVLGIRMWRMASREPESTRVVRAGVDMSDSDDRHLCRYSDSGDFELKPRCVRGLVGWGLVIGFMSGFLGVGGGFLIIPILLYVSSMPMSKAVGTSLLIIAPVSLSGFISYYWFMPHLSLGQLGWIVGGGIVGMAVGTKLADRIAGPNLQKVFAAILILLVGVSAVQAFI
ncbi:Uncharacterised protein [BD1-7 clade bacterium]|uniref:Probable membrane transporter protein n=1 Tax=BD1-7 clade bacterium TaxID=2029982 RepID=A0A5S9PWK0_9GAMM|nr:Uncharacterised protein [BD1-7 clade bacterium]CAA0109466.1 Uncharacterised protein [BD1-7 clade bacterium]